jgi:hypothetical protein
MTRERATSLERVPERTLARLLSIAGRAAAATPGPRGYLRASGVICGPDASDIAHCLHDPDATFIAHARSDVPWLLDQLQAGWSVDPALDAQLLDRVVVLGAAIRGGQPGVEQTALAERRAARLRRRGLGPRPGPLDLPVLETVASALDPETLGLKDGGS